MLVAPFAWGNKHRAHKGKAIVLANRSDILPLDPIIVGAIDMRPITPTNAALVPGPRASRGMRQRLGSLKAMKADIPPDGG